MKGRFDAIKYARSLEKQLSSEPPRKRKLREALADIERRAATQKDKGSDVSKLEEMLAAARRSLEANDLARAEEQAQSCEDILRSFQALSVEEVLSRARGVMEDASMLGVDISRAQELERQGREARAAGDEAKAIKLFESARAEAEKAWEADVSGAVSYSEGLVTESEKWGMEVSEFRKKVEEAKRFVSGRDYNAAINLTSTLPDDMDRARRNFFRERLQRDQGLLEGARKAGRDLSALEGALSRARQFMESRDYESADELLRGLEAESVRERGLKEEAEGALRAAGELMEKVEDLGIQPKELGSDLQKARELHSGGELQRSVELARRVRTKLEELVGGSEELSALTEEVRKTLSAASKMGMDVRAHQSRMKQVEGHRKAGRLEEAEGAARELLSELSRGQMGLSQGALASLEADLRQLRQAGAVADSAEALYKKARAAQAEGRPADAFTLARETLNEMEELREGFDLARRSLERGEQLLKAAAEGELDASAAAPMLEEARSLFKKGEYGRAAETGGGALKLLEEAISDRTSEGISSALAQLERADAEDARVEEAESLALEALRLVENGAFGQAASTASELERAVSAQTRAYLLSADALAKAKEAVAEALMMELDVTSEKRKLDSARSACERGEYESARYQAEDLIPSLRQRARQAAEATIREASARIDEYGQSGAELPAAREYLRRARELAECGRFNLGHQHAVLAEREAQRVGDRFREAVDARGLLESSLAGAREAGVGVEELQASLKSVSSLMEERRYEEALSLAAEAVERSGERMGKEAREQCDRLSDLLSAVRSVDLDTSAEKEELDRGVALARKGEPGKALALVRAARERLEARRAEHGRARTVLDSAEGLLAEAETHGLKAGPLRERLAEAARSFSTGRFEESVREAGAVSESAERLLAEKASQTVGALRNLAEGAERSGVVLGDLPERIEQLVAAIPSRNFGLVFKEAQSLFREVERRTARHDEGSAALSRIQSFIEESKGIGAVVTPAEDLIGLARFASERGAYDDVMDYCRRAELELTAATEAVVRGLEGGLREKVEAHRKEGVELGAVAASLAESSKLLEQRQFRTAFNNLKHVETEMEVRRDQFRNTQKVLNSAQARLSEAESLGVKTQEAADLLERASRSAASGDYPKAVELAELCRDTVARIIESHQQTIGAIELARTHAREAEAMGADIARAQELLEQAASSLAGRSYDVALERAAETEQELVRSQETLVQDRQELALAAVDAAARIGADTSRAKELLSKSEKAFQSREFEEAFRLNMEAYESAQESRGRHSASLGTLTDIQKLVQAGQSEGFRLDPLVAELEEAREALQRFDYNTVNDLADRCRKRAEEIIEMATSARRLLERCERELRSAVEVGADTAGTEEVLAQAREGFAAGRYSAVKEKAELCHRRLSDVQHEVVWATLGELLLELECEQSRGVQVEPAEAILDEAGEALASGEFIRSLGLTTACREKLTQARHQHEEASAAMAAGTVAVEEARLMEADVSVASDLLAGAEEAAASFNYTGARELALQSAEEALRSQRSLFSGLVSTADKAVAEAESWGIRSRAARDRLSRAKVALESQDFKGARDLFEDCDDHLAQAIGDHKSVMERMGELGEAVARAQGMDVDVFAARAEASRIEGLVAAGIYGPALEAYDRLFEQLVAAEKEGVSSRIARVRKAVEGARAEGMEVSSQASGLEQAQAALGAGDVLKAHELAVKASSDLEGNRAEFGRVGAMGASLEEAIRASRELGVEAQAAEALLAKGRELLSRGSYTAAEAELQRGSATVASALTEAMTGRLAETERSLRTLEAEGIRSPRGADLLKEASQLHHSGEYLGMLKALTACTSELELARRAHAEVQARLAEAEARARTMESLGVAPARFVELLGRSREASSAGDFATASSLLDESFALADSQERALVQGLLGSAGSVMDEGDSVGASVTHARENLAEARRLLEQKDHAGAAALARAAMEEAERQVGEHRKYLHILTSREREIADAESSGLSMEKPRRALEELRRSLKKYDYEAVVAGAERIRAEVEVLAKQSREARRIINFCERKLNAAMQIGADVKSAEGLLSEAKAATEKRVFVRAFELGTRCLHELDSMQHSVVLGFLTDTEVQLAGIGESGSDLTEPAELLEVAFEALNENEFEKALELGRQALEVARVKKAEYETSAETLKELELKLKDASDVGGDVKGTAELLEKARSALAAHDHAGVTELTVRGNEALNAALWRLVSGRTKEASQAVLEVEEGGASVDRARDRINRAKRALECGDHKSALNLIEDAVAESVEARARHQETMELVKGLQSLAREATELGMDISRTRRALAEVEEAVDRGLYAEANRVLTSSRSELEKGFSKYAEQALVDCRQAFKKATELGASLQSEEKLIAESEGLMGQERYTDVLKSCRECLRRVDERINDHIAEEILRGEELLNEAGKVGVDARDFRALLERSEEAVSEGSYEAALKLAQDCVGRTRAVLRSSVSTTISTLGGLVEEARKIGADVSEVEELSRKAQAALDGEEYEPAHDQALSGIAAVDRIREDFVASRIKEVDHRLREAEEMGVAVEDLRKAQSRSREFLDKADFERAVALLSETEETTRKRQHRLAEEAIRKAEDLMAKVKPPMDVDLSRARSLSEEARTALGEGELEEALDCASQSVEETHRVQRQYVEEVISASAEGLQSAREMGSEAKKAAELLEWAQADLANGAYDSALDKAVQSSNESDRAQHEQVRGPLEYCRRLMKEAGLSDQRIERLLSSAEGHAASRDFSEAYLEVRQALDLTKGVQEKLARKAIAEAEETLSKLEKGGTRMPSAQALLTSALKALNSRDFEHATKYARECTAQASRTEGDYKKAGAALKALEADAGALKEMDLARADITDILELARNAFELGDYSKVASLASQGADMVSKSLVKAAGEALSVSQFRINYAKNIGADVSAAEGLLKEAKDAHVAKDYRKAIEIARKCREEAERAKERYKEVVDTIYAAESKIQVAQTYGLDTAAADKLLTQAVSLKSTSGEEALDFARQCTEEVQRALERFVPEVKVEVKLEGVLQKEKWSDGSLVMTNTGRAAAKDMYIRFSGDVDIHGHEKVPILRNGESRRQAVRVRPAKGGDLPLGMAVMFMREFDGKEYRVQETRWVRVEDATPLATPVSQFVTKAVRCHICLGTIKSGLPLVRCECGKTYHETCASRVGECPNCGRDLRNTAAA